MVIGYPRGSVVKESECRWKAWPWSSTIPHLFTGLFYSVSYFDSKMSTPPTVVLLRIIIPCRPVSCMLTGNRYPGFLCDISLVARSGIICQGRTTLYSIDELRMCSNWTIMGGLNSKIWPIERVRPVQLCYYPSNIIHSLMTAACLQFASTSFVSQGYVPVVPE